ncbi:MAG: hypothetical protein NT118_08145, partial [Lentisphaerae bacterium]|nr:hypothetical protein [Lentisphaerota bacterium]
MSPPLYSPYDTDFFIREDEKINFIFQILDVESSNSKIIALPNSAPLSLCDYSDCFAVLAPKDIDEIAEYGMIT